MDRIPRVPRLQHLSRPFIRAAEGFGPSDSADSTPPKTLPYHRPWPPFLPAPWFYRGSYPFPTCVCGFHASPPVTHLPPQSDSCARHSARLFIPVKFTDRNQPWIYPGPPAFPPRSVGGGSRCARKELTGHPGPNSRGARGGAGKGARGQGAEQGPCRVWAGPLTFSHLVLLNCNSHCLLRPELFLS